MVTAVNHRARKHHRWSYRTAREQNYPPGKEGITTQKEHKGLIWEHRVYLRPYFLLKANKLGISTRKADTTKGAIATKIHEGDEDRESTSTSPSVAVVTGIRLRKLRTTCFWSGQQRGQGTGRPETEIAGKLRLCYKSLPHSRVSTQLAEVQDKGKFPQRKVPRGLRVNEAE